MALCNTQHARKEIVTRPMSEYFANDPDCHDLLPCTLRSHRVAGSLKFRRCIPLNAHTTLDFRLGRRIGGSHRAACGWIHVHVDSGPVGLCGPVALYLLQ